MSPPLRAQYAIAENPFEVPAERQDKNTSDGAESRNFGMLDPNAIITSEEQKHNDGFRSMIPSSFLAAFVPCPNDSSSQNELAIDVLNFMW